MEVDLKWIINEEERTRHDALFFSQKPKNGYLSGEQARSLFIRSRLPLSELSKIWKLADITRDNLLDISEFATAMHLIQLRLKGFEIPEKLPSSLIPIKVPTTDLPKMTFEEREAYERIFKAKESNNSGFVNTETACEIMIRSHLDYKILSKIWNLSDIDRDTLLSSDEFAIALHLLRICKNGYQLEGSTDVMSMVPSEAAKETEETKRQRLTVLQKEKKNLLSIKEKLCLQISLGDHEKEIQENLRPELNKVEGRLYAIEKEETLLRKHLQNLRDKSKKEGFKPFDRNYLVKKFISGDDLFKKLPKNAFSGQDDGQLFERLLIESEQSIDSKVSKDSGDGEKLTSSEKTQTKHSTRIVNELKSSDSETTQQPVESSPLVNGLNENHHETENTRTAVETSFKESIITRESQPSEVKEDELRDFKSRETSTGNNRRDNEEVQSAANEEAVIVQIEENSLRSQPETQGVDSTKEEAVDEEDSFSWVPSGKREIIVETVHEEVLVKSRKEPKKQELPKVQNSHSGTSFDRNERFGNTGEKSKASRLNNQSIDIIKQEKTEPVHEDIKVDVVQSTESAADANIDAIFRQMSLDVDSDKLDMENSVNGSVSASAQGSTKLPVGRVLSDEEEEELVKTGKLSKEKPAHYYRQISKENQLYIEEMRQKEEERKRVREIEDEKRRKAREELETKEQVMQMELNERKYELREVRGRLEEQLSMVEQDEVPVVTKKVNASQLIELELEEQKRKEAETRRIAQEMKGIEQQQKERDEQMRARQPSAAKEINVEESANTSAVQRRQKKADAPPQSHRKSFVELEIQRQKEQEAALKQEIAQRNQQAQLAQGDVKTRDQLQRREIEITEEKPVNVVQSSSVESQPGNQMRPAPNMYSRPAFNRNPSEDIQVKRAVPIKPPSSKGDALTKPTTKKVDTVTLSNNEQQETKRAPQIVGKVLDEEEKRRLEDQGEFRRESLRREAEELMRQKRIREEELQRRRDEARKEAEKRKKDEMERNTLFRQECESRKFAFHAHKVQLEERVLKAMEDRQDQETRHSRSSSTSSEEHGTSSWKSAAPTTAQPPAQASASSSTPHVDATDGADTRERRKSVRESLVAFESKSANKDAAPKDLVRRNRISLNLEDVGKTEPDVKKLGKTNRSSYYGDGFMAREMQKQQEREEELLKKAGPYRSTDKSRPPNLIIVPKDRSSGADHIDIRSPNLEDMSEERIRQEIEDLKQKEKEIQARRNMLERMSSSSSSSPGAWKDLEEVKRNPLPNKVQIRKAPTPSGPAAKPIQTAASRPVTQPVAPSRPVTQPVASASSRPVTQPVAPSRPVLQPVASASSRPVTQPVAPSRPVVQPVTSASSRPVTQPVAPSRTVMQPVASAPSRPVAQPVASAQSRPVTQPVAPSRPVTQPVTSSERKPAAKEATKKSNVRKSFIELEKERELQREEEMRREREAVRQELQSKEEQKKVASK